MTMILMAMTKRVMIMTKTNRVNAAWRCCIDDTLESSQVISSHSNISAENLVYRSNKSTKGVFYMSIRRIIGGTYRTFPWALSSARAGRVNLTSCSKDTQNSTSCTFLQIFHFQHCHRKRCKMLVIKCLWLIWNCSFLNSATPPSLWDVFRNYLPIRLNWCLCSASKIFCSVWFILIILITCITSI